MPSFKWLVLIKSFWYYEQEININEKIVIKKENTTNPNVKEKLKKDREKKK